MTPAIIVANIPNIHKDTLENQLFFFLESLKCPILDLFILFLFPIFILLFFLNIIFISPLSNNKRGRLEYEKEKKSTIERFNCSKS